MPMTLPPEEVDAIRRSRRHPKPTQFDFLHLRYMISGLTEVLRSVPRPVGDVLDVWCGSRPYDDLLPQAARHVALDVEGNPYGVADVVSDDFLPFANESFDLVVCIQAFQYVPAPEAAIEEFCRVLRPGGTVVVALPFALEYDPSILERRYTGPQLVALFDGWEDVRAHQHGGRAVTWAVLTASMLRNVEKRTTRGRVLRALRPLFLGAYALLNGVGLAMAKIEERQVGTGVLPMNLLVTARRLREPAAVATDGPR